MKVAIAHDFIRHGGAEKVLEQIVHLWPQAPIHTLLSEDNPAYKDWDIHSSSLQSWLPKDKYRWPMLFYPGMVDRLSKKIEWNVDLLISSSVSYMKNLQAPSNIPHLCMIYRPAMFAYDRQSEFLSGYSPLMRPVMKFASNKFKQWDQAGAKNPDLYVACSKYVAAKVKELYRQEAEVVYPPVDTTAFLKAGQEFQSGDYYFTALRLESYKRVEIVVEACTKLNIPLKIAGTGPMKDALQKIAGPKVEFLGFVPSEKMPRHVAECRAFIFPSEEDFGIAPVEALATGRPVIAFGAAGALETVSDGITGVHFSEQTSASLEQAIQRANEISWDSEVLRKSAQRFSVEEFRETFSSTAKSLLANWNN